MLNYENIRKTKQPRRRFWNQIRKMKNRSLRTQRPQLRNSLRRTESGLDSKLLHRLELHNSVSESYVMDYVLLYFTNTNVNCKINYISLLRYFRFNVSMREKNWKSKLGRFFSSSCYSHYPSAADKTHHIISISAKEMLVILVHDNTQQPVTRIEFIKVNRNTL